MKIQVCLTIALLALSFNISAQTGESYGGPASDYGYQVEATADGGFVVAGRTYSYGAGDMDFWLAKFDSLGNKVWSLPYGTVTYEQLLSLRMASDGSFLLAGLTGIFGSGLEGAMLYKISPTGQVIWNKIVNYGNADHAHVLFENLEGGYYFAGHTDSKGDAMGDIWVVKLDSARNIVWDKVYGSQSVGEHAHAAALTPDSGVVVFGHTQVGNHEKFRVVKVYKDGSQQWAQTYSTGSTTDDIAYEIRVTKQGNYALFGSTIDALGNGTFWLKVIDPSGNSVMDKHFGTGTNFCWSGRQTEDNGFMMIGVKSIATTNDDMIVMKTDASGTLQWSKTYGGNYSDVGYGFAGLRKDRYVLVGSTTSYAVGGGDDMWVVLVDSAGNTVNFPLVAKDASIRKILTPSDFSCNTTYAPQVVLKNSGTDLLSAVTINYREDNGTVKTHAWTGSLASLAVTTVTLPAQTTANGPHALQVWTSNPNGVSDMNQLNDSAAVNFSIDTKLSSLPVSQDFESATWPPVDWHVTGSDYMLSSYGAGGFGASSKSLKADFLNVQSGSASLISTQLNMSALTPPLTLNFAVAYAPYDNSGQYPDSLKVKVSPDCGLTWQVVYAKTGSVLATAAALSTGPFVPTSQQWRREYVNLASYAGKNVLISFEAVTGYGNNLYLDDINIINAVGIDEERSTGNIMVYPNPAGNMLFVECAGNTSDEMHFMLQNTLGETVKTVTAYNARTEIDLSGLPSGVYVISSFSENAHFSRKILIMR